MKPPEHDGSAPTQSGEVSPSLPFAANHVINGKYRLDRLIGQGGMGSVWAATDMTLERAVAIKVLSRMTSLLGGTERLLREARAIAKLQHDAIVRVIDFGLTDGELPFMVMELLDGEDLWALTRKRGRLPVREGVRVMLPVVEGLVVAHARGIIHRDVKPENILLARLDLGRVQPKLLDFGIARVPITASDPRLTQHGAFVGTPQYMAPEQLRGEQADARADIWSLCTTLYQIITGRFCFSGANLTELLQNILTAPLSFPTDVPGFDGALFAILARGLRKTPAERTASTAILASELTGWLVTHGETTDITGRTLGGSPASAPTLPAELPASLAKTRTQPPAPEPPASILDEAILSSLRKP